MKLTLFVPSLFLFFLFTDLLKAILALLQFITHMNERLCLIKNVCAFIFFVNWYEGKQSSPKYAFLKTYFFIGYIHTQFHNWLSNKSLDYSSLCYFRHCDTMHENYRIMNRFLILWVWRCAKFHNSYFYGFLFKIFLV